MNSLGNKPLLEARQKPGSANRLEAAAPAVLRHPYIAAIIIAAIALAVFWRTQDHGFVWDDGINVERNDYLKPVTLSNLAHFWVAPHENLYVPLTYTAWGAIAYFARLPAKDGREIEFNPRFFHTANNIVHALSALVVFAILRLLVKHDWAAGAGALLFALHPVQVEPVAWITGLKDVLSGLLSLVAVWQYLAYSAGAAGMQGASRDKVPGTPEESHVKISLRSRLPYFAATLAFVLALMAKPAAVMAPVVAWILDILILKRSARQSAVSLGVWMLIALPFVILTKWQQPDTLLDIVTPLWRRPLVAADALAFYFYKLFLPLWLGPGYSRSPEFIFDEGWAYLTWILPLIFGAATWYLRRRKPWLVAAAGVFVAGLLPVLGIVQFQFQNWSTVADRYLYLSMLGPALAFAWLLAEQWHRGRWAGAAGAILLLLLGFKCARQVEIWHNSETLWRHALEIGQESAVAHANLGAPLVDSNLDEAFVHLRRAVALAPDFPNAHFNLAVALTRRGALAEAIDHYRYLLKLRPKFPDAHYLLAVDLYNTGQSEEAIKYYRQALQLKPADAKARNGLGNALADRGRLAEAVEQYREAIKINPAYAGAYFNLGIALADRGDLDEAARQYRTALQLEPDNANAHNNLADILARQGQRETAIDHFREALRLKPDFPEAQRGLSRLLGGPAKP